MNVSRSPGSPSSATSTVKVKDRSPLHLQPRAVIEVPVVLVQE